MSLRRAARTAFGVLLLLGLIDPAHAQIAVRNQGYIPFSEPPINYRTAEVTDPVTQLQRKLEQGATHLDFEPEHGYLRSVLKLLDVPVDSQMLVYSKTSFQYPKISPAHPRALYFNDDVYVGAVHEGKAIEIVSFDPNQGAIFFLLDERRAEKPTFERAELDCTQCHIAAGTRGIPGVLLRSVRTTPAGAVAPGARSLITDQASPFAERWGGWYVTQTLGSASAHLGNKVTVTPAVADGTDSLAPSGPAAALADLGKAYDPSAYVAPNSDAVALLVLAHQTQMHNLITLTNYRARIAQYSAARPGDGDAGAAMATTELPEGVRAQYERPAEQLLRYLLFANEVPLAGVDATALLAASPFARSFQARGPRDPRGRSLRDFDLATRLFRYPCSYLIYSEAFDALPKPARNYVYHRLLQVLSGEDTSADFSGLSPADRRNVLEILLATKRGLPQEWIDYGRTTGIRLTDNRIPKTPPIIQESHR
jgi:hypothetical protein